MKRISMDPDGEMKAGSQTQVYLVESMVCTAERSRGYLPLVTALQLLGRGASRVDIYGRGDKDAGCLGRQAQSVPALHFSTTNS
jgi:hypothetical protein